MVLGIFISSGSVVCNLCSYGLCGISFLWYEILADNKKAGL
jgi:hypothetical protein